jgi:1,4-dihydroxy-2-naphthoyl-CoA hydrolase
MSTSPTFEHYNEDIAQRFLEASQAVTGLPGYLGIEITQIEPGRLAARLAVRDELLTPFGNLHGGVMAAFVDHVLGCVLYPLIEPGQWAATTEFKLNYLAPARAGHLIGDSTVVSLSRRTGVVRVEVTNDDRLVCVAQGTLLITDPKSKPGP